VLTRVPPSVLRRTGDKLNVDGATDSSDDSEPVDGGRRRSTSRSRSTRWCSKRARYETAGCPSYWVVDPDQPSITVWEIEEGRYVERAHQRALLCRAETGRAAQLTRKSGVFGVHLSPATSANESLTKPTRPLRPPFDRGPHR
jgi:hypothetical protein